MKVLEAYSERDLRNRLKRFVKSSLPIHLEIYVINNRDPKPGAPCSSVWFPDPRSASWKWFCPLNIVGKNWLPPVTAPPFSSSHCCLSKFQTQDSLSLNPIVTDLQLAWSSKGKGSSPKETQDKPGDGAHAFYSQHLPGLQSKF